MSDMLSGLVDEAWLRSENRLRNVPEGKHDLRGMRYVFKEELMETITDRLIDKMGVKGAGAFSVSWRGESEDPSIS